MYPSPSISKVLNASFISSSVNIVSVISFIYLTFLPFFFVPSSDADSILASI